MTAPLILPSRVSQHKQYFLDSWISSRRYSDIASELPAVLNVLQLFDNYVEVEQVKNLTEKVQNLKADLSAQLSADLRQQFNVSAASIREP